MLSSADRVLSPAHKPAEPKKLPWLVPRRRLSWCPQARARTHVSRPRSAVLYCACLGRGRSGGWRAGRGLREAEELLPGRRVDLGRPASLPLGRDGAGGGWHPSCCQGVCAGSSADAGGQRGRTFGEKARRPCRPSSCGLHPGRWPVGGRRDGRLGEKAAGRPGTPLALRDFLSLLGRRFHGERAGRRPDPGSRRRPGTGRVRRSQVWGVRDGLLVFWPGGLCWSTRLRLLRFFWFSPELSVPPPSLAAEVPWVCLTSPGQWVLRQFPVACQNRVPPLPTWFTAVSAPDESAAPGI